MYVGFWSRKHYSLIGKENKIELKTDYMPRTILRGKGTSSLSTYVSCPSSTNVLTGRRKHECPPRECHVLFWYNDTHTHISKRNKCGLNSCSMEHSGLTQLYSYRVSRKQTCIEHLAHDRQTYSHT